MPFSTYIQGIFHVSKRNKLEAFGKKVTFVGYSENSKACIISVFGQINLEISHVVTFDEDISLGKARDAPIPRKDNDDVVERQDEPVTNEHMSNVEGPMDPIYPPSGVPSISRKRPLWLIDTLKDVEKHIALRGTFHESKNLNRYQWYFIVMNIIVQTKPCPFEEVVKHQVWKDVMNEEYESIMKNDMWDVVLRLKDKSVVTSKWLYKIKHGADGSVEKYKPIFISQGFSQKEGVDYDKIFASVAQYTTIRSIIALVVTQ